MTSSSKFLLYTSLFVLLFSACRKDTIDVVPVDPPVDSVPVVVQPIIEVPVRVLLNGIPLSFEGQQAFVESQLVYIPGEVLFEALGFSISWNQDSSSMVAIKGNNSLVFTTGTIKAQLNGIDFNQLVAPFYRTGDFMIEARALTQLSNMQVDYDSDGNNLMLYDYDQLDYGLYFFDAEEGTWGAWDKPACEKFVKGQTNKYFDPSKPTIIWSHGWQNGGVVAKSRPAFHLYKDGNDRYVHNKWKYEGYNVAIFHWVPFADELLPYDAESKINAASNNDVNMRWKKSDGNYALFDSIVTEPVAEIFAQLYADVAAVQTNPTIRLAGSSFGGQVVLHGTERIVNNGTQPLPSQIALLDMAWTSNYVDNQSLYTTEITERAVDVVAPKIPIEYYRTSLLTTFFTPRKLVEKSAFQEMVFGYAANYNLELKHTIITYHYFWSLDYAAPSALDPQQQAAGGALSATTDTTTIRQMMTDQFHWQHKTGTSTFTPVDDVYEKQSGSGA